LTFIRNGVDSLIMKLENLQKIVKTLGYELTIANDEIYSIEDFEIYQTENPVMVRSLKSHPHPTNKTWMVQITAYDSGSRWEPPSSDVYDIDEFDSLELAIKETLGFLQKRNIEGLFQSYGEEEWAEEERKIDWNNV